MEIKLYNELPKEAVEIRHKVFAEEQGFQNEFDEKKGYSCCGKTDLDENCPHIWMHKEI